MIGNLLQDVCNRITDYLDGDLEAAVRLPHHLIDLERELELEEESEWSYQTLGKKASTEDEGHWRDIIEGMFEKKNMPEHVYADKRFLDGKQFQWAKGLLKALMAGKGHCLIFRILQLLFAQTIFCIQTIEAFPDFTKMKEFVASGAGYLQGGLQQENWERGERKKLSSNNNLTL